MPIIHDAARQLFSLAGRESEYIFALDGAGLLKHLYWGPRTSCLDDIEAGLTFTISSNDPAPEMTPEEYAPRGGLRYKECCLAVTYADGTRDLMLTYEGCRIDGDTLSLRLRDPHYPLGVTLRYRLREELDIIERWAEIENKGTEAITIDAVSSAGFCFSAAELHLTNVTGYWGGEQRLFRERLTPGRKILDGRRGNTGHGHSPYFVLDRGAGEERGHVWFGVLEYTGNFSIAVETTHYGTVNVTAGIGTHDFAWRLDAGETFITPPLHCGFTDGGFETMSHRLHHLCRHHLMPASHREAVRPVLYNSWEATGFAVTAENQIALAEKAAALGVELFVVDDGWFGGRHNDAAGLGDWQVNAEKFPIGLAPLIERVKELGMDFGIWVEPEMVNPDSDCYRAHPEWVYRFPNREPTTARNQLVLNLTMPAVRQFIIGFMSGMLQTNDISFVKWDLNRPIAEAGAANLQSQDRRSVWHRNTLALYEIVDTLRARFPAVAFEACASGGGRVDYGCLRRFDQYWTSDNTDALDRLSIQEGYSLIYPIKAMRAWVTDCPNFLDKRSIPLRYRFHAAMMGTLGIGVDLNRMSDTDLALARDLVAQYKTLHHIVQEGLLYRISSIETGIAAVQYVLNRRESALFVLTRGERFGRELFTVCLRGLEPGRRYRVDMDGFVFEKSGDYLHRIGLTLYLPGDYASQLAVITALD